MPDEGEFINESVSPVLTTSGEQTAWWPKERASAAWTHNGVENGGGVLRGRLLPGEVADLQHNQAAVGDPLVQELGVDEGHDVVVPSGNDGDRGGDLRKELGQYGQLLGVSRT
jgi:hypothetical protein